MNLSRRHHVLRDCRCKEETGTILRGNKTRGRPEARLGSSRGGAGGRRRDCLAIGRDVPGLEAKDRCGELQAPSSQPVSAGRGVVFLTVMASLARPVPSDI